MRLSIFVFLKIISVAALALAMGSAGAQQSGLQSYDVELVIFRTLNSKATPEDWGIEAGTADQHLAVPTDEETGQPSSVIAPLPPVNPPTMTFPALPQAKYKLGPIADSLRRSQNFRPLAHFGWTQPGFTRGEPRYMSIDSLVGAGSGLSGQIALSRGRYLHLTLELTLTSSEDGGQRLVLKQTRRMRSNERHYIDHPKFGVVAIITPSA